MLSATNLIAPVYGSVQPHNPLFDGFRMECEGHPQPCWHGILIGTAHVEDAVNILHKLGYTIYADSPNFLALENVKTPLCKINLDYSLIGVVDYMSWGDCKNVRCGDFYAYFYEPNRAVLEGSCDDPRTYEKSQTKLLFADLLIIRALSCGRMGLPPC
jgi:hypothetical protein